MDDRNITHKLKFVYPAWIEDSHRIVQSMSRDASGHVCGPNHTKAIVEMSMSNLEKGGDGFEAAIYCRIPCCFKHLGDDTVRDLNKAASGNQLWQAEWIARRATAAECLGLNRKKEPLPITIHVVVIPPPSEEDKQQMINACAQPLVGVDRREMCSNSMMPIDSMQPAAMKGGDAFVAGALMPVQPYHPQTLNVNKQKLLWDEDLNYRKKSFLSQMSQACSSQDNVGRMNLAVPRLFQSFGNGHNFRNLTLNHVVMPRATTTHGFMDTGLGSMVLTAGYEKDCKVGIPTWPAGFTSDI